MIGVDAVLEASFLPSTDHSVPSSFDLLPHSYVATFS